MAYYDPASKTDNKSNSPTARAIGGKRDASCLSGMNTDTEHESKHMRKIQNNECEEEAQDQEQGEEEQQEHQSEDGEYEDEEHEEEKDAEGQDGNDQDARDRETIAMLTRELQRLQSVLVARANVRARQSASQRTSKKR